MNIFCFKDLSSVSEIPISFLAFSNPCIFRYGKWNTTTTSGIFAFAVFFCPESIQRLFLRMTCLFTVLRIKVPIRIYPCHILHGRCNGCFYSCIQCSCIKSHSTPATDSNDSYFSFLYSSSLTGSSHSSVIPEAIRATTVIILLVFTLISWLFQFSPKSISSLKCANSGANSPSVFLPAVCTIFSYSVYLHNAVIYKEFTHSLISCFVPQFSSLPCLNCIVLLFDYTQLQFKMISICFYKALFL